MLIPCALTLLLLGFIQSVGSGEPPENHPSCNPPNCHDPDVAAFSAAFYTALVFSNDPEIVFKLTMNSKQASSALYKIVLGKLKKVKVCNAVIVAKTVAKGVSFLEVFKLPDYFHRKGFTIGDFLKKLKILNCDNAIELALTIFKIIQHLLDKLGGTKIEHFMDAITGGIIEYVHQKKLNAVQSAHDLAALFYKEFSKA